MASETRTSEQDSAPPPSKTVPPPSKIVWYTGLSLFVYALLMICMIYCLEEYEPTPKDRLPMTRFMVLTLFAGAVGGCVSNIRKMVKYMHKFDETCNFWYYLHPLQGAICGAVVVILLLGGVLTLSQPPAENEVWRGTGPLMPFVAFAVLAGYASNKFIFKLSDLADSAFAVSEAKRAKEKQENKKQQ